MFAGTSTKDESYHKFIFHTVFYQSIRFFANLTMQVRISSIFC